MFLYRAKYIESEYDIQNEDLLYKIEQQGQNTFELFEQFGEIIDNFRKINKYNILLSINSIISIL